MKRFFIFTVLIGTLAFGSSAFVSASDLSNQISSCTLDTSGTLADGDVWAFDFLTCTTGVDETNTSQVVGVRIPSAFIGLSTTWIRVYAKDHNIAPSNFDLIVETTQYDSYTLNDEWLYLDYSATGVDIDEVIVEIYKASDYGSSSATALQNSIYIMQDDYVIEMLAFTSQEYEQGLEDGYTQGYYEGKREGFIDVAPLDSYDDESYSAGYDVGVDVGNSSGYDVGYADAEDDTAFNIYSGGIASYGYSSNTSVDFELGADSISGADLDFEQLLDWIFKPFDLLEVHIFGDITFGHFAFISIMFGMITFLFRFKGGK